MPWGALRHPIFAVVWAATVVSSLGGWVSTAASEWLMTALNPDPFVVSLVQVASNLPLFILALPAGALTDIVDRRKFLICSELAIMGSCVTLAILVSSHLVTPGSLLLMTALISAAVANLIPPGIDAVWEATGSSRGVVIVMRPEFLSRAIEEHWDVDSRNVRMIKQFLIRDPVIEALTVNLARAASNPFPAGRLYAESACEFLAHHLIHHYSTLSATPPRPIGGLPGRRLKRVLEYIEGTLGRPIELRSLAALSGVSARHLERAFRQSMGMPPHAYVLRKRLEAVTC
jgi:AraC-like DNA-binding protein